MAKRILYIDREAFLDWYFDEDVIRQFVHDQRVMEELIETGEFSINAESLLGAVGFLPENVAMEGQVVKLNQLDEIDTDYYHEIKFYDFVASKTMNNGEV